MSEEERQGEKTERASPRKRQQAREKGQVARGRDLTSMAALAGVIAIFYFAGPSVMGRMEDLTGRLLSCGYGTDPVTVTKEAVIGMFRILTPFLALPFALALGAGFAQGGLVLKPLSFELDKLNPVEGFTRMFSKDGLVEIVKSLVKFSAGGVVFYIVVKRCIKSLPGTSALGLLDIQKSGFAFVSKAVLDAFGVFLVAAAADYLLDRWKFERSLMMTREELKQEYKETEGDPLIKSRIRSLQRET
ncbi:MAG: EscU/YscU/HrcU family type III secretion system export apparatus switch protein, partial [Nitrospiraceae bacterium]|nr:EscU/YscU/HrcU family type III secretion system export apparatus switch protein [Nitrospiraceae bacterium]